MEQRQWQQYMGDMLGLLTNAVAAFGRGKGDKAPNLPLYSEIAGKKEQKSEQTSIEEDIQHVYEAWGIVPPGRG